MIVAARAPLDNLLAYQQRMGWSLEWVSTLNSDFNYDFDVSFTDQQLSDQQVSYNYGNTPFSMSEAPGLSVFYRDDDVIYHTYSCFARGLDPLNAAYQHLDLTPKGRDEEQLPYPMAWLKRRDEY